MRSKDLGIFSAIALAVALVPGCAPQSPEQRVATLRAAYTVEPTSFTVLDEPQPEGELDEITEASPEASTEDVAEEETGAPTEELPVRTDIVLDLLVTTSERDTLPGITAEFEQRRGGELVEHRLLWLDTSQVALGAGAQISETVRDVEYQPGDEFTVYVRPNVPAEERSEYREFQASDEGS